MRALDGRRLLGPNLLAAEPLVLVEVALEAGDSLDAAAAAFGAELSRLRLALGLHPDVNLHVRPHQGGAVFAYPAPRDQLLPLVDASEWAAKSAAEVLAGAPGLPLEPVRAEVAGLLEQAANPALVALLERAAREGAPVLLDDEIFSLGYGVHGESWPLSALPEPDTLSWDQYAAVPIAMVTGTNGKTTTTRLLARLAHAGQPGCVGSTSTDGVQIGAQIVERGDCTGPMAARRVLRDKSVELAVLETARGGILRRGLAVDACDVAVLTNVAADHLHDYGIDDVDAMLTAKAVVARAARRGVVLNAADPRLVRLAAELAVPVVWFADLTRDDARAVLAARPADVALIADGDRLQLRQGEQRLELGTASELPITFGGRARYNVENVLAALGAAHLLGLSLVGLRESLRSFGAEHNPGRGQVIEHEGIRYLIDFGHNADGARALAPVVEGLRGAGALTVVAGSPGDRSDKELGELVDAIADMRPERVLVRELHDYLRGRALGEVPELYRRRLAARGLGARFELVASEADGLARARQGSQAGDLVVLLTHVDPAGVQAFFAGLPGGKA